MADLQLALEQSVLDTSQKLNCSFLQQKEFFVFLLISIECRNIGLVPAMQEVVFQLLFHAQDLLNRLKTLKEEVGVAQRIFFNHLVNFCRGFCLFFS